MSSPVAAPEPQCFREDAHASPERVVLVPLDDVSSLVSRSLLDYVGAHVYRPGDTLLLLHVVPPMRWRADDDAPGAGLANALAAGVSVATLNAFADDARHDDEEASWLDDTVSLLEGASRRRRRCYENGVPRPIRASSSPRQHQREHRRYDLHGGTRSRREAGGDGETGLPRRALRALLGSATNRVVRKCQSPVLVWNVAPERTKKQAVSDAEDVLDDPAYV